MADGDGEVRSGRLAKARAAFDEGDYSSALKLSDEVLAEEESNRLALMITAGSEAALEQFEVFDKTIEKALRLHPEDTWPTIAQALSFSQRGDTARARELAQKATEVNEEDPDAWDAFAEILIEDGSYQEALDAAAKAAALTSDSAGPWVTRARAAYLIGDYQLALNSAEEALSRGDDSLAWLMKANALSGLGRNLDGVEAAEKAKEKLPKDASAWSIYGTTLSAVRRHADSIAAFEKAAELDPDDPNHISNIAIGRLNLEEYERALPLFEQALAADGSDLRIKAWIGATHGELEDYATALGIFEEVLEEDPTQRQTWLWRGIAERLLGWYEQAANSFRRALALDGWKEAEIWLQLGRTCADKNDLRTAARCYAQARDLDRSIPEAWVGIAVVEIRQNMQLTALNTLNDAEKAAGPSAIIEFNRGIAQSQLGQSGEAQRAWRRARDLDSEFSAAELLIREETVALPPGGWVEYWFGAGRHWLRKTSGFALVVLLLFVLALSVLKRGVVPGFTNGDPGLSTLIPVVGLAAIVFLPTIRSLKVGSVSLEALPVNSEVRQAPFDPVRINPALESSDVRLPGQ
jgi:tetratricopeptide (TPR) repeat protein